MPAVRRVGNFLFANLVSLVSGVHITDSASGMRIFSCGDHNEDCLRRLDADGCNMVSPCLNRVTGGGVLTV
jgi:hypothetical protein